MKVLLLYGSPHKNGCTKTALDEIAGELKKNGVDSDFFWVENKPLSGCIACKTCIKNNKCVFDDRVNEFLESQKIMTVIFLEPRCTGEDLPERSLHFWTEHFTQI